MCDFVQYLTESCSEEAAHIAVRTLIDLGVSGTFTFECVFLNLFGTLGVIQLPKSSILTAVGAHVSLNLIW